VFVGSLYYVYIDKLILADVFFKYITQKVFKACSRTSYKTVPLTNLNKYSHYDTSETEMNINTRVNNGSENS
jgi:hypothetical protein